MSKYLKCKSPNSQCYDQATKLLIGRRAIVKAERISRAMQKKLLAGGVLEVTKEEYEAYLNKSGKPIEVEDVVVEKKVSEPKESGSAPAKERELPDFSKMGKGPVKEKKDTKKKKTKEQPKD